jgi:hypothetical protein
MPNPTLKLRKANPERLRAMGLDEAWLQNQIAHDTSLLNLGELSLFRREKSQHTGGRIDFLMTDSVGETMYEIEVMLGETDASHIIRTIEYWDIERQRYPDLVHRAVIVAEEITSRFFNVIRLLNRAVPIIAIQLSAFRLGDEIVLQFTRVLDVSESVEPEDEEASEPVDRSFWERKSSPESLAVVDAIKGLTPTTSGEPRLTFNKHHIALGTSGYNFCWLHPRKAHCHLQLKVGADNRPEIIDQLEKAGIDASTRGRSSIVLRLSMKDIEEHREPIASVIKVAEELSHR